MLRARSQSIHDRASSGSMKNKDTVRYSFMHHTTNSDSSPLGYVLHCIFAISCIPLAWAPATNTNTRSRTKHHQTISTVAHHPSQIILVTAVDFISKPLLLHLLQKHVVFPRVEMVVIVDMSLFVF